MKIGDYWLLKNGEVHLISGKAGNRLLLEDSSDDIIEFTVGDRVKLADGTDFSNGKTVNTISKIVGTCIYLQETGTYVTMDEIVLADKPVYIPVFKRLKEGGTVTTRLGNKFMLTKWLDTWLLINDGKVRYSGTDLSSLVNKLDVVKYEEP